MKATDPSQSRFALRRTTGRDQPARWMRRGWAKALAAPVIAAIVVIMAVVAAALPTPAMFNPVTRPLLAAPSVREPAGITHLDVTRRIETQSPGEPIRENDVVIYVIRLEYTGDRVRNFGVAEQIPWPLRLAGRVHVEEVTPPVQSEPVEIRYQRLETGGTDTLVRWRGSLASGSIVEIHIPVEIQVVCRPGATEIQRTAQATVKALSGPDESTVVEEKYTIACPPQISLDLIKTHLELVAPGTESTPSRAADPTEELFGAYNFILARMRFVNNNPLPAVVGYRLDTRFIGETEKNLQPRNTREQTALGEPEARTTQADEEYFTPIWLNPGETRTVEVWTDMRPGFLLSRNAINVDNWYSTFWANGLRPYSDHPELFYSLIEFELNHLLLPAVQLRERQVPAPAEADIRKTRRQVRMQGWDLGDAPDSSNHSDRRMDAYLGVQASFPTVFSQPPSSVPGPAHARPDLFHLGRSYSLEADADLGAGPNIDPPGGSADLDLFDDGVNPNAWQLEHCQTTTIDVGIFISQRAVEWFTHHRQPGYLNVWLDFDRNGQWGRVIDCNGVRAFEHIVIDQPINVAELGAGHHRVRVTTGPIYWPPGQAQEPAWTRVMLSETPSEKVGSVSGVAHGDGRGPGHPYFMGETEDYLIRPAGAAGAGPDLEVLLSGTWRPVLGPDLRLAATDFTFQKIEWNWVVDFGNIGSQTAEDVQLFFEFSRPLTEQQIEANVSLGLVAPRRDAQTIYYRLQPQSYTVENNRIIIPLEAIEPGQRGKLQVRFIPDVGDEVLVRSGETEWFTRAGILSPNDINPENSIMSFKAVSGLDELIEWPQESSLTGRSPGSPFWVPGGTTNRDRLSYTGMLPTGETFLYLSEDGSLFEAPAIEMGYITIWVDRLAETRSRPEYLAPGVYVEEVSFRANGSFEFELENLPDGYFEVAVGHPAACDMEASSLAGNDNEWRYVPGLKRYATTCSRFMVDSTLPIDPISLGFVEVPADSAQVVVGSDGQGNPRVEGPVFLPDTLGWSEGDWTLRLPPSRPGTEYVAVFGLKSDIAPTQVGLIEQFAEGQRNVAAVETAIPAFYETAPFFFDEADAIFGKRTSLTMRVQTDEQDHEYPGRGIVAPRGRLLIESGRDLHVPVPAALNPQVYVLVGVQQEGTTIFVPWDGSAYGQSNPTAPDSQGNYSISVPPGVYQLWAYAEGYQPYRSDSFRAAGPIAVDVTLRPAIPDEMSKVIILDQDGMTQVNPGEWIQFVSMDAHPRLLEIQGPIDQEWLYAQTTMNGSRQGMVVAAGDDDILSIRSPLLLFGESFGVRVGQGGELRVIDIQNPGSESVVRIAQEPDDPGDDDPGGDDPGGDDPGGDDPGGDDPGGDDPGGDDPGGDDPGGDDPGGDDPGGDDPGGDDPGGDDEPEGESAGQIYLPQLSR